MGRGPVHCDSCYVQINCYDLCTLLIFPNQNKHALVPNGLGAIAQCVYDSSY